MIGDLIDRAYGTEHGIRSLVALQFSDDVEDTIDFASLGRHCHRLLRERSSNV